MHRFLIFSAVMILVGIALSCGGPNANDAGGDTPTEAYKRLFAAVKAKDVAAIRAQMTQRTIDQARASAKQWGKTEDEVVSHGMTSSTDAENLPPLRDERIKDNMGAVEVWNSKDGMWQDMPFMIEGGKWKLALGELFAGTYKFPGKGKNTLAQEASNALSNQMNINAHPANAANGK